MSMSQLGSVRPVASGPAPLPQKQGLLQPHEALSLPWFIENVTSVVEEPRLAPVFQAWRSRGGN